VLRRDPDGVTVAVVHRPKYDDWSFPKGKLDEGESHEAAALREVSEETGFTCELDRELPSTRYHDRFGRPNVVRYWTMRPVTGAFRVTTEVDELRWASLGDAARLLTYAHDRDLLASIEA